MKDNILKKEFSKKDVQRIRNLVTKKHNDKTTIGIGYNPEKEDHVEGDIWVENGKKWTIKDRIKQNITKLDKIKELSLVPLFCPSCSNIMNHRNDKVIYNNHKKCFNCMVEYETELRKLGLWEEYEKKIHNEGIDNFINDFQMWVEESIKDNNQSYVTEQGDIEKWDSNLNIDKINQNMEESIKYLKNLKK